MLPGSSASVPSVGGIFRGMKPEQWRNWDGIELVTSSDFKTSNRDLMSKDVPVCTAVKG
jgi:hypothetical protein